MKLLLVALEIGRGDIFFNKDVGSEMTQQRLSKRALTLGGSIKYDVQLFV